MDQFVVGIIRSPHGLSGICKVESTSGEYEHFCELKEVTFRSGAVEKTVSIESVETVTAFLLVKFGGIDTLEDAKRYSGWELVVPRKQACPLKQGEYYAAELRLCALVYYTGEAHNGLAENAAPAIVVGTVTDVLEGGAGDLLEVSLTESCDVLIRNGISIYPGKNGSAADTETRKVLIPFKSEFIGDVDLVHKTIRLMHLWILE
jgi:16S rRNA processing protein RimM